VCAPMVKGAGLSRAIPDAVEALHAVLLLILWRLSLASIGANAKCLISLQWQNMIQRGPLQDHPRQDHKRAFVYCARSGMRQKHFFSSPFDFHCR
jgi:hypothetical protein